MLNDCARCEILAREMDNVPGPGLWRAARQRWPFMRQYLRHLWSDHNASG